MNFIRNLSILAVAAVVASTSTAADSQPFDDSVPVGVVPAHRLDSAERSLANDLLANFASRLGTLDTQPSTLNDVITDTVHVAVVRSRVPNLNRFDHLNANWSLYGDLPVAIDKSMASATFIDESQLRAMDPDVICISSPVTVGQIYSNTDINVLLELQSEGTHIVVVGVALGSDGVLDNRALGQVIGIQTDGHNYQRTTTPEKFEPLLRSDLLRHLPRDPFDMPDSLSTETPANDKWTSAHLLPGTQRIAMSEDGTAIETLSPSNGNGSGNGIYNSYTLEYGSTPNGREEERAAQLLYNMLTYGFAPEGQPVGGNLTTDGEPFSNRPVLLARNEVGCDYKDVTDENGTYAFENVEPGTYALEIPNIVNNPAGAQGAIIIASGYLEIDNEPAANQRVYGVQIDVFPFNVEGPDITDVNGLWELSLPSTGRWVVYAPGIGVVAKD